MHATTKIDFFTERLNAESERKISFAVGGNELQILITRSVYLLLLLVLAFLVDPVVRVAQVVLRNHVVPVDQYLQYFQCLHVAQSILSLLHDPANQCLLSVP